MNVSHRIVFLLVSLALFLYATGTFLPNNAYASTSTPSFVMLGGINLDGYCQFINDTRASLDGSTAYDWHCVTSGGQHVGFDMTAACIWQYHDSQAQDTIVNYYNPWSWQCFNNATYMGGANLDGYCKANNYSGVTLSGNTAYDWHCVDRNGNKVPFLSVARACGWTYPGSLSRLGNFFESSSWQCWR